MNIVAYCRVSTEKADQLNSLEAQKKFFEEYAKKQGYNLVTIYADEGISGTKIKNRKEFQRMLRDASHGIFDMVVVKDISRFARNTVDLLDSTRKLKELGIETTFLTANMTVLGQSEFVLTIFGALAQEESANTSKRVKFGKKINAEKGRVPNIVYGYDKTKGDYFNLKVNEFEANIVRRIYDLYINSGFGTTKIAKILNEENVRTKRENSWQQAGIARILTNEIYTGKIINGKEEIADFLTGKRNKKDECDWKIVDKPELKIIDDKIFIKAQKIMAERTALRNLNHARHSDKHLFSSIIRCEGCGYSFRRIARPKEIYWVCSGRNSSGVDFCKNKTKIDEENLKSEIKGYFVTILSNKERVVSNITSEFRKIYHSKEENADLEDTLTEKLAKSNKTRKKYMEMYEDELITRDEFREKVSALNMQIEKIENELKLTRYNLNKGDQFEKILESTFKDLDAIFDIDNMTNAMLKKIIDKITVNEQGNINVYLKLLSDIGLEQTVLVNADQT